MHPFRTRFSGDIAAEFLPPTKPGRDVIVLCDGFPSVPAKKDVLEFLSSRGFWVFHPRYRGSWESGGTMFKREPTEDILDVIRKLPLGFREFWGDRKFQVKPKRLFVLGSSFGGTAALLASGSPMVTASVAFSPVVDWSSQSRTEPLPQLKKFVRRAFRNAFRIEPGGWSKLGSGGFYQSVGSIDRINHEKAFIIQCKDDDIVANIPVRRFATSNSIEYVEYKHGGYISLRDLVHRPRYWNQVDKFFSRFSTQKT